MKEYLQKDCQKLPTKILADHALMPKIKDALDYCDTFKFPSMQEEYDAYIVTAKEEKELFSKTGKPTILKAIWNVLTYNNYNIIQAYDTQFIGESRQTGPD